MVQQIPTGPNHSCLFYFGAGYVISKRLLPNATVLNEVERKFSLKAEKNALRPFIEKYVFVILSTGFGLIYQLANCVKTHFSGSAS